MRRQSGISLFHPPARKPTVLRRYGAFAGIGLLVGAVAGLGLTQMPVGEVAAVTSTAGKPCGAVARGEGDRAGCARERATSNDPLAKHCTPAHRCATKSLRGHESDRPKR